MPVRQDHFGTVTTMGESFSAKEGVPDVFVIALLPCRHHRRSCHRANVVGVRVYPPSFPRLILRNVFIQLLHIIMFRYGILSSKTKRVHSSLWVLNVSIVPSP